jgi:hypothetical protein
MPLSTKPLRRTKLYQGHHHQRRESAPVQIWRTEQASHILSSRSARTHCSLSLQFAANSSGACCAFSVHLTWLKRTVNTTFSMGHQSWPGALLKISNFHMDRSMLNEYEMILLFWLGKTILRVRFPVIQHYNRDLAKLVTFFGLNMKIL